MVQSINMDHTGTLLKAQVAKNWFEIFQNFLSSKFVCDEINFLFQVDLNIQIVDVVLEQM